MKKYKRKAGSILLAVFTAILLVGALFSSPPQKTSSEKQTVIHAQEFSGEAPGNVSRSFTEGASFEGRIFQDFVCQTLQEFHSNLSHTGYVQANFTKAQFTAPEKVHKRIRQFLV